MRQPGFHVLLDRLCKTALVALLSLPGSVTATELCDSAADRLFIFSEPAQGIPDGAQRCYATELPSTGVWLVDANAGLGTDVRPSLWISATPCDADPEDTGPFLQALHRTAGSALLRVLAPGRHLFCVTARDPGQTLGRYWVSSLFAPNAAAGDPDEDEPDPRPFSYRP